LLFYYQSRPKLIFGLQTNFKMTTDNNHSTDVEALRTNINNETSQINWSELQRFFAGGWLIYVSSSTNLLDVAVAFSVDDKEQVSRWLTSGEVAKVSDNQAKLWHQENVMFWANVVKPWVLIQPLKAADDISATTTRPH